MKNSILASQVAEETRTEITRVDGELIRRFSAQMIMSMNIMAVRKNMIKIKMRITEMIVTEMEIGIDTQIEIEIEMGMWTKTEITIKTDIHMIMIDILEMVVVIEIRSMDAIKTEIKIDILVIGIKTNILIANEIEIIKDVIKTEIGIRVRIKTKTDIPVITV